MGNRISRPNTDLGDAESRLRSQLSLEGPLGLGFPGAPDIVPVVLLADGSAPGNTGYRGRQWCCGGYRTATTNSGCIIQAQDKVIVDRLWFTPVATISNGVQIRKGSSGTTPGITPTDPVNFVSLCETDTEYAPVLSAHADGGNPNGVIIIQPGSLSTGPLHTFELGIVLQPLEFLGIRVTTNTAYGWGWIGRVF